MRKFSISLAALALSGAVAFAQDTAPAESEAPAEQAEAPMKIGETYVKEETGDWKIRCARAPIGKPDPCDMFQILRNENDEPVAEVSVQTLNATAELAADLVIVAPLGLLLPAGVQISVDGRQGGAIPFIVCNPKSCVARASMKPADVQAFKAGNAAELVLVPADRSRPPFGAKLSLSGFTAGFEMLPKPKPAE